MASPAASFSRIISTVIRVPETTGLPIMIFGLELIKASGTRTSIDLSLQYSDGKLATAPSNITVSRAVTGARIPLGTPNEITNCRGIDA